LFFLLHFPCPFQNFVYISNSFFIFPWSFPSSSYLCSSFPYFSFISFHLFLSLSFLFISIILFPNSYCKLSFPKIFFSSIPFIFLASQY
jgi:hypothetical protein